MPTAANSESFLIGAIVILGILVVVLLAIASRVQAIIAKGVDERMKDEDSVFGRHRIDAYAHEPMRRMQMGEISAEVNKLRTEMQEQNRNHREEMTAFTELMKPIIEQNRFAMDLMATQMRRQPGTRDDGT